MTAVEHQVTHSIERTGGGFQQTTGAYVADCSCGVSIKTPMGRGLLGAHRLAVAAHAGAELHPNSVIDGDHVAYAVLDVLTAAEDVVVSWATEAEAAMNGHEPNFINEPTLTARRQLVDAVREYQRLCRTDENNKTGNAVTDGGL